MLWCSAGIRWIWALGYEERRCWCNWPCNYFPKFPTYVILIHQHHRQTDRWTDRRTTCNLNTALGTRPSASRGKNLRTFPKKVFSSPDMDAQLCIAHYLRIARYLNAETGTWSIGVGNRLCFTSRPHPGPHLRYACFRRYLVAKTM